jgi:O-antigen ligase
VRQPAASLWLAIVALAVVGTALAVWPGFLDSFRFRSPKVAVLGVAGAMAAVAFACQKRDRLRLTFADLALLGYLGAGITSALVYGRVWTRGAGWASQELAALLVFWAASRAVTEHPDGHERILRIIVASASIVAALVVLEALGVELLEARARPVATIGNRNWVGLYLAAALPLVVTRQLFAAPRWGLVQLALIGAALIMTRSRGAWLAVVVVALCAVALVAWRRARRSPALGAGRVLAMVATGLLTAGVVASIPWPGLHWKEPSPYSASLQRLVAHDTGTGRLRADQLRVGAAIVAAHPLLGVGPLQWHDAFDEHAHAAPARHVDGSYGSPVPPSFLLRIAVETGLTGLLGFLAAMAWLVRGSLRRLHDGTADRTATVATLAALLTVSVHGVFEAPLYNAESLTLIAALAGTLRSARGAWSFDPPRNLARVALAALATFALAIAILRVATSPTESLETTRADQRLFPMPEVTESIALGLTRQGQCGDAATELEQTVRWSPHHVEPLIRAGYCALQAGDRVRGIDLLRRAVAIEPHRRDDVDRIARRFRIEGL